MFNKKLSQFNTFILIILFVNILFTFASCDTEEICEHIWGNWTEKTPANCIEAKILERFCINCNELETQTEGAPIGHKYDEYIRITEATETANGTGTMACQRNGCNYIETFGELATSYFEIIDNVAYRVIRSTVVPPNNIYIPAEYNNLPVTEIGRTDATDVNSVFAQRTNITTVYIPDTVTAININAFNNCNNLITVNMSEGLKTIGNRAFANCQNMVYLYLPDSIITIGTGAINGTGITEIIIPKSMKVIGWMAFQNCSNIKNVIMHDEVTTIDVYAFSSCDITSITIPSSVTVIKNGAFAFTSLNSVTFEGIIEDVNFASNAFDGDLRIKYLEGGSGTYKCDNRYNKVWTKE